MTSGRYNILLYGGYERAIFGRALKEGFATTIDFQDEKLNISDIARWDYQTEYARNRFKSAVLQMFLIYDKVILVKPANMYDTQKLINTGFFDLISTEEEPALVGSQEWDLPEREYAMHLKPFLMKRLVNELSKEEKAALRRHGLTGQQFFSTFYDMTFSPDLKALKGHDEVERVVRFVENYTRETYNKQEQRWEEIGISSGMARDMTRFRWTFQIGRASCREKCRSRW